MCQLSSRTLSVSPPDRLAFFGNTYKNRNASGWYFLFQLCSLLPACGFLRFCRPLLFCCPLLLCRPLLCPAILLSFFILQQLEPSTSVYCCSPSLKASPLSDVPKTLSHFIPRGSLGRASLWLSQCMLMARYIKASSVSLSTLAYFPHNMIPICRKYPSVLGLQALWP